MASREDFKMIYASFMECAEGCIIPLQQANPTWLRLDGEQPGDNRNIVAKFRYDGTVWKIHGDSRFEPFRRAFEAVASGNIEDPFVRERTKNGDCLNLIQPLRGSQRAKHFYVYETK
ncbi:MAG: hypothetical protein JWN14_3066 [Chthonomonadales bacterium]|nr:hypothetical protein [Chthonomonadales bacterium]